MNTRSWKHILWIPINGVLAFGLPFLSLGLFRLPASVFYAILILCSGAFIWYYSRGSKLNWRESLNAGWALGIILGVFIGLAFFSMAYSGSLNSIQDWPRVVIMPLLWQGFVYGLFSAVLISVFPFVVTWRALAGANPGAIRKMAVTLAAVIAVGFVSFLYNLGMSTFNGRSLGDQFRKSMLASVPTIISGSPLAAPISSIFLQVSETVISLEQANASQLKQSETARSKSAPGGID